MLINMKTRNSFKRRTARFISDPMSLPKMRRNISRREGAIAAIAIKGDQFWDKGHNREFATAKGIQEGYKSMDKTFHDMDHSESNRQDGLKIRLKDIVGCHNYTEYDPQTKEMIIFIYPWEEMPGYQTWGPFIDGCNKSGITPNVSTEYISYDEQMKASEIGDLINYKSFGIKDDDMIWVEQSYRFLGAGTVWIGGCDSEDGCGIINNNNNNNDDIKDRIEDNDTKEEKMNNMSKEDEIEDIEVIAVKDRKIEILKGKLQDCGKLRADLEIELEDVKLRIGSLEAEEETIVPEVKEEEVKSESIALAEEVVNLREQLKESEEKLTKPVTRKQVTPAHADENKGLSALRWLNSNKIRFNTPIKGE